MPLKFRCACGKVLKVADTMAGSWVTCPGCRSLAPVANFIRVPKKPHAPSSSHEDNDDTVVLDFDDLPADMPIPLPKPQPPPTAPPRPTMAADPDALSVWRPLPGSGAPGDPDALSVWKPLLPRPVPKPVRPGDDLETVELICDGCGRPLRLPPSAAGLHVRCPYCKYELTGKPGEEIYIAPIDEKAEAKRLAFGGDFEGLSHVPTEPERALEQERQARLERRRQRLQEEEAAVLGSMIRWPMVVGGAGGMVIGAGLMAVGVATDDSWKSPVTISGFSVLFIGFGALAFGVMGRLFR